MTALRSWVLAAAVAASGPGTAAEDTPDLAGTKVASVDLIAPGVARTGELARFLEIRKGDVYSPRSVRRTIEVLSKLGEFARIWVEAAEAPGGVALSVHLVPVPRVRKVVLRGVTASKSRVLGSLAVNPGDPYNGPGELQRMADDVASAYRRAGWRDVSVEVIARVTDGGDVILECVVQEGRRQRIRSIHFIGEYQDAFTEETFVRESRLEVGDPVTDGALEAAGGRVVRYLRKLGYLEARISRVVPQRDAATGDAIVKYFVVPGERIEIHFDKKNVAWADQRRHPLWFWEFRDSRLLSLLDLENEAHFTGGFASEAADRIESYYRERGYLEAEVTESFQVDEAKRRKRIDFKIRPGRRYRLRSVAFKGTEEGPSEIAPKVLLREFFAYSSVLDDRHYVPEEVDAAALHVTNFVRSHGFDGARIQAAEPEVDRVKRTVSLSFEVVPGPRSIVGRVTFEGNAEAPETRLREVVAGEPSGIREGAPLNAVFLDRADGALEDYYARIGFPYAHARHELGLRRRPAPEGVGDPGGAEPAPPARQNVIDVHYKIDESFQAYVGRTIIRGNRHTRREAIERVLPFETGQSYTPQALAEGQEALYKLGPFARVSVVPTEPGEPERVRDILVAVSEANRIVVEPSIGVSWPEEGPRVGLRAQHRNLFGNGESLSLRAQANWRWSGLLGETKGVNRVAPAVDYTQIEERVLLTYAQPTTFGFPVNGSVTASLFERERNRAFGYTGNRVVAAADQRIEPGIPLLRSADVRLVGRFQMFLRDVQYASRAQQDAVAVVREDFQFPVGDMFDWPLKWKIASGSLGTLVDGRNDRVNPTAGYTFTFNGEVADAAFASDADYLRFLAAWSLFRPAPGRFGVALSMRGGVGRPLGRSRGIPVDQRFHLGGTGSVRGFRESEIGPKFDGVRTVSTGGDVAGSYALELRHRLAGGFDWVFFTDGGWSRLRYREPDPPDVIRGRLRNPDSLATSVGVGLRVKTLVGPIKLDLGIDTAELDRLASINGTREHVLVHFTIGDF